MKTLFAVLLASLLSGCFSHGQMTQHHDPAKPRSVFVEPVPGFTEYTELIDYAGIGLGRRGYDAITDESAANYRLRSSLQWSFFGKVYLAVRLVDVNSGQVIYFGDCRNPTSGSGSAVRNCYIDALDLLQ